MIDNTELQAMKAYFQAVKYFLGFNVLIKTNDEQLILKSLDDGLESALLWDFGQFFGLKLVDSKFYEGEFGRWIEYVFEEM